MGWNPFESTKEIHVATSVSRVIKDSLLPNSVKTGLVKGVFSGDQLVENVLEDIANSIGIRAERMYNYGKSGYIHGLPSSTLLWTGMGNTLIKEILEDKTGKEITLDYLHYGSLNHMHYGWQVLVDTYKHNSNTNELQLLSEQKGTPVYLSDFQVVITEATQEELKNGSLEQWGRSPTAGYTPLRAAQGTTIDGLCSLTPYAVESGAKEDYFRVTYVWEEHSIVIIDGVKYDKSIIKTNVLTFPMQAPHLVEYGLLVKTRTDTSGYFQVKYSWKGSQSSEAGVGYWTHRDGDVGYPQLGKVFSTEHSLFGSYFPIGYFRYNRQDTAGDASSTRYRSSKKLMKYLGIDFADVAEAINNNPDIDKVESALLMMAVPADSVDVLECRYLFDFFKGIYQQTGETQSVTTTATEQEVANSLFGAPARQTSIVIQDSQFKMSVNLRDIYYRRRTGNIGTYASGLGTREVDIKTIHYSSKVDTVGTPQVSTRHIDCYYYQHQLTENLYEEFEVTGLNMRYHVWDGYYASSMESQKNLLIPLDHAITSKYFALDREVLYARSLNYVFNSKTETEIKWYQSSFFQFLMIVVAVVITILSWGTSSAAIAAAVAAATVTVEALIITILTFAFKMLVMNLACKLFVKIFGEQFAFVVVIIAAIYGMMGTSGTSAVQGAPWASEMLQVASGLSSAVTSSFNTAMAGIQQDALEFSAYTKEQTELLENTNKLLEQQNVLSPLILFGESPSDYYQRTVHSGNVGIAAIDSLTYYVDRQLALPTLAKTISDSFDYV